MFLNAHLKGQLFEERTSAAVERAAARYSEQLRAAYAVLLQQTPRPQPLTGFERYWANLQRVRARRRF